MRPADSVRAGPARAVLTYADILVVQLGGAVAVEAQAAVLAVLAPRVVLAAHAGHHVQEVDVAAAVGVAVALAVCGGEEATVGTGAPFPRAGRRKGAAVQEGMPLPEQGWDVLGRRRAHGSPPPWGDRAGNHRSGSTAGSGSL